MQLIININLDKQLILPLNYNHIVQSIIYRALSVIPEYADFIHDNGYMNGNRSYKMFNFGQLKGEYRIEGRNIIFSKFVSLEVRSPLSMLINILKYSFETNGITFGEKTFNDILIEIYDYTIEDSEINIEMNSPVTVYSTDEYMGNTYYYAPTDVEFSDMIDANFKRKYFSYYGVRPYSNVEIELLNNTAPRKMVTKYQGLYVNAWFGRYRLSGERKYLDFLYQTGLGSKNSQGFGMFSLV
jgi:CRISPR-associated endoribonuclease Cas6